MSNWNMDLNVAKDMNLFRERVAATVAFQFTNVFNHVVLNDPYLSISAIRRLGRPRFEQRQRRWWPSKHAAAAYVPLAAPVLGSENGLGASGVILGAPFLFWGRRAAWKGGCSQDWLPHPSAELQWGGQFCLPPPFQAASFFYRRNFPRGPHKLAVTCYERRLPHWDVVGQPLFVTFRLHGTLPASRVFPPQRLSSGKAFVAMDRILDGARCGPAYLGRTEIAELVMNALFAGECKFRRYQLHAFVVMPNHVHVLVTPKVFATRWLGPLKGFTGSSGQPGAGHCRAELSGKMRAMTT